MSRRSADEDLQAAGRRAFARFGFAGATLERIAQEAGVSRVTLHRRGVSRESILEGLAEAATEQYQRAIWPALTGAGTGRDRLEAALGIVCDQAEANLELLLAVSSRTMATVFHEEGDEVMTRGVFTEPLDRLLRDGAADGSLQAVDPVETATVLFNLVGWTYLHLRVEHRWQPERARRATLDVAINGVAARSS